MMHMRNPETQLCGHEAGNMPKIQSKKAGSLNHGRGAALALTAAVCSICGFLQVLGCSPPKTCQQCLLKYLQDVSVNTTSLNKHTRSYTDIY